MLALAMIANASFQSITQDAGRMTRARYVEKPLGPLAVEFSEKLNLRNARFDPDRPSI